MFLSGSDKLPLTEDGKLSMHKCNSYVTIVLCYFNHYHVTSQIAYRITFSRFVHIRFNCFCENLLYAPGSNDLRCIVLGLSEFACQFVCLHIFTMPYTFLQQLTFDQGVVFICDAHVAWVKYFLRWSATLTSLVL